MLYTYENLTIDIDPIDGEILGDVFFEIKPEHVEPFFSQWCGLDEFEEDQYGDLETGIGLLQKQGNSYHCTEPDILIAYMKWALSEDYPITIETQYSHPFWAIHDLEHARFDTIGCTVSVNGETEKARLLDAFHLCCENDCLPDFELVDELEDAFYSRFKIKLGLLDAYNEKLMELEEEYA